MCSFVSLSISSFSCCPGTQFHPCIHYRTVYFVLYRSWGEDISKLIYLSFVGAEDFLCLHKTADSYSLQFGCRASLLSSLYSSSRGNCLCPTCSFASRRVSSPLLDAVLDSGLFLPSPLFSPSIRHTVVTFKISDTTNLFSSVAKRARSLLSSSGTGFITNIKLRNQAPQLRIRPAHSPKCAHPS